MTEEELLGQAIELMRESVRKVNTRFGAKFTIRWDIGHTKYQNRKMDKPMFPVIVEWPGRICDDTLIFGRRDLEVYVGGDHRKVDEALTAHLEILDRTALSCDTSMKLSIREIGDITILDAEGPYDWEWGLTKVLKAIEKLIGDGRKNFLLNLAGIRYIDSGGLSHIFRGFNACVNAGGVLKLLSPSQRVVEGLTITHLNEVIEMYVDESAALDSFKL